MESKYLSLTENKHRFWIMHYIEMVQSFYEGCITANFEM